MNAVWDRKYDLGSLDSLVEHNSGQNVSLCTVRSSNLGDTKLGNVFWVLLARRLAKKQCKVNIYDFPEKGQGPSAIVTNKLVEIFEVGNTRVSKAEDHNQERARKELKRFAKIYSSNPSAYPGLIPAVSEGLLKSKEGLDPSLDRMSEELAIFLEGHENPRAVQFSNHESETVQLVRYLGNPKKRFVRMDLGGIESEFRAERVAKVKDLPTKIILGSGLGQKYNHFNSKVLEEMAHALSEIAFERFPKKQFGDNMEGREKGWDYEIQRNNLILSKIDQINPHLQTYLAILLKDKGHQCYMDPEVFGNELRRATKHVSKLENPDYTWIFKHLKQYESGFGDLKSFFIDLTRRALPTIDSDELLEVGKHFYGSISIMV